MISGRIDVHAHLIPGIDDGCPTLQDSLACAKLYVQAGYSHVFCTPHVWPQLPRNNVPGIAQGMDALQKELDQARIPLRLLPGGEYNMQISWPAIGEEELGQIVTYSLAGKYMLFDFWADSYTDFLEPAVKRLTARGLKLVMAHPERVKAIQDDPKLVHRLLDLGLLLQGNTWCFMDPPGMPTRVVSERFLKDGRYFLLGGDCHNAASLPKRFHGVQRAIEWVGASAIDELTIVNPSKLLPPNG